MATGKERMADLRWRRGVQGLRQVTVWLDQESIDRLVDLRALQAEGHRLYQAELQPIVDKLEDLLHRERWHISPSVLADQAVLFTRGLARLCRVFGIEMEPPPKGRRADGTW